jgi:hypothetical protein
MKLWTWIRQRVARLVRWFRRDAPHFRRIVRVDSLPDVPVLAADEVALVVDDSVFKWTVLNCPCGCREQIRVSLMRSHYPHWELNIEPDETITLHPSLWRGTGCRSHFFVRRGKVEWC